MGTHAPLCDISEDKIVDFETEIMPIPQFDTEHPQMISQGPSVCIFNKEDAQEVMASWLFVQYLLTNEVQIAYSETEGYVPVTAKAQESAEYQDYLSRGGENNTLYYDIKIKAVKMLLEHIEHTFVTPVFVGSASLRDASGQLIESTVKSARRGQEIDDAYIDKLYSDTASLYRLDQIGNKGSLATSNKADLGELPGTAKALLMGLGAAWMLILLYVILGAVKKKRH